MKVAFTFIRCAPSVMNRLCFITMALSALMNIHCAPEEKRQPVDFASRVPIATDANRRSNLPQLSVIVTSIYSARESFSHFQELFSTVGAKCSVAVTMRYCRNYRDALLLFKTDSADVGIVSPSLFVFGKKEKCMRLLAVPEIDGKTSFRAYIIVPKQSAAQRFDDLKNGGFAFTDSLSLVGYFYPMRHTLMGIDFWHTAVFAGSYDKALDLVNRSIVDGSSIASYVFDYFNSRFPERTANIRIIEKSMEFGLPPIVIGNRVDAAGALSLRKAFLSLTADSAGINLLHSIGMDRFVTAPETLYESAARMVPDIAVQ